ncbi:MAG: FAD-dependent oxidoreductase [Rhodocyclaceae bacterium]|nr:FAD-dependent oxidoreductase [Rhodocyclaceae bacterium]
MKRPEMLARVEDGRPWDLLVIGGGATGLGIAVDAAARGYAVLLVERDDFAQGTSSRSTKLVHGGVRYLQQGNLGLVREALEERGILRRNAPHLVRDLAFVVPSYAWWESPFYGVGLKFYDFLAGHHGFGPSRHLSGAEVAAAIPTIATAGLHGGTLYYDGQFDDARLAIHLARTAADEGATLVNYCEARALTKDGARRVVGAILLDRESGREQAVAARAVINATGPFCDTLRRLDDPDADSIIAPSQGVHLVLDRGFLPGNSALMVPHTDDGRVLFAIPWHHCVLVGTTDTPVPAVAREPRASGEEIDFLLDNLNRYLSRPASRADVRSVFAGIRPLVRGTGHAATTSLSRDHSLFRDPRSGLITVTGGKWTTYRRMAQDTVNLAAGAAGLIPRPCITRALPIHGSHPAAEHFGTLAHYGADAPAIVELAGRDPALGERLHPRLPAIAAEVVWACRHEMARTVEDVLGRRTRSLFFDAEAAAAAAPAVARLMAAELGRDSEWEQVQSRTFQSLAALYRADSNAATGRP